MNLQVPALHPETAKPQSNRPAHKRPLPAIALIMQDPKPQNVEGSGFRDFTATVRFFDLGPCR